MEISPNSLKQTTIIQVKFQIKYYQFIFIKLRSKKVKVTLEPLGETANELLGLDVGGHSGQLAVDVEGDLDLEHVVVLLDHLDARTLAPVLAQHLVEEDDLGHFDRHVVLRRAPVAHHRRPYAGGRHWQPRQDQAVRVARERVHHQQRQVLLYTGPTCRMIAVTCLILISFDKILTTQFQVAVFKITFSRL